GSRLPGDGEITLASVHVITGMDRMERLRLVTVLVASAASVGTAGAGGFSRGTADTDLIFEEGNFNLRAGVAVVMPQRGYATVTAPPGAVLSGGAATPGQTYASTDGKYSDQYAVPTAAVKFNFH